MNKTFTQTAILLTALLTLTIACPSGGATPLVDTGQSVCYDTVDPITCPTPGQTYYGQDAQYAGSPSSYTLSGDGLTVMDNVTGLTWTQSPDLDNDGQIDLSDKLTFAETQTYPATLNAANFGGYDDWRVPSIKELYSLMDFTGITGFSADTSVPYIDTNIFAFGYGDEAAGERFIDAQFCSSTVYVSTVMGGSQADFGLNLADGRIKGYDIVMPDNSEKLFYVMLVRGNTRYGANTFIDNGDGTITDLATGLMWQQADSGTGRNWPDALDYAENLTAAGHSDWRLPNAKELQSILDYTRSPDTTGSAAIDPLFSSTPIIDEGGNTNYPFYWTGTTHNDGPDSSYAVYICFGEALGFMQSPFPPFDYTLMDVHGAGAQRSDPKTGDPADYPFGHGPQGDVVRIYNFVRAVRNSQCNDPGFASTAGDLTGNCYTDLDDATLLAANWVTTYDLDDFANLAADWSTCTDPAAPCNYLP